MKKSLVLLVSAFLLFQYQVNASTVSQQTAQTIATNFFQVTVPGAATTQLSLSLSYTKTESNGAVDFYVFNVSPMKGFVIVAGDNNATPILAYSSESNFPSAIPTKMGLGDWIKSASTRISYIVTNNIAADARIQNLWASYAAGQNPNTNRATTLGPLLTTTWNQEPYYNSLCPPAALASTSNSKSVTGCVATAMAQIMKYWNYPAQGTGGTISYDDNGPPSYSVNYGTLTTNLNRPLNWAAMNVANVTSNTSPVDSLMYELGVAVHMDYDSTGSGAYVLSSQSGGGPSSQTVYPGNFYYNPNTIQGVLLSSYTDAAWVTVMENEINAGRVVQYEGQDPTQGGHTWVMDGYQTSTTASGGALLHMNWGWGGVYDGWFDVTNLTTGTGAGAFDPSEDDGALIGIEPIAPFSVVLTPTSPSACPSSGATLTVQGPASATYTWTPATGLSCTTCSNPVATPSTSTLYTVSVDSAGVVVTASVAVTVPGAVTANFSSNISASCNLPENVAFTNSSVNATSYLWDFGDGHTSTATSPVHAYTTAGSYTATLYATNACGVDSLISSQPIQITGGAPSVTGATVCTGQTATLTATGSGIDWYADAGGATLMQSGNSYTTAPLTGNVTFYVGSSVNPAATTAGPATDAIGTAANYTQTGIHGLLFNSTVVQTLTSVVVYSNSAQTLTFALYDSTGSTVITSTAESLIAGQQTVPLNFLLPAGETCMLAINGAANLFRNSTGAAYPYVSADGTLSITGNNLNAQGRYYYFYDWQLQQAACNSALAPVTVYVLNAGGGAFTATGTGGTTVSFTPQNLTATTYEWSFGDGQTSTSTSPTHVYTNAGKYTVQLIESNGSCADTITETVNTNVLGVNDVTAISGISVSPNPASNMITLSLNSANELSGCQIRVSNLLGQTEFTNEVNVNSGSNKFDINIANLTTGVYFLTFENGKDVVTTKFVKSND